MPTLSVSPSYSSNALLTEAQLDSIRTPIQTLLNTTLLDTVNVDMTDVIDNLAAQEAGIVLTKRGLGSSATSSVGTRTSFNTSYADITSVTVPDTGLYLICASAFTDLQKDSTTASQITGQLFFRIFNETTTTAIGPEMEIQFELDSIATFTTTIITKPVTFNYMTSLTENDVLKFQGYRDTGAGVADSDVDNAMISLVRLKI